MTITTDINKSISALFRGISYVRTNRWIWNYIYTAILLNLLVFIGMVILLAQTVVSFVDWLLVTFSLDAGSTVYVFIQILGTLLALFIGVVLFSTLSSIVNAPVYSIMTDRLIKEKGGISHTSYKERGAIAEIFLAIGLEIKKLILIISIFIMTLLFNILPGIGQVVFILINGLQLILITGIDLFEPLVAKKQLTFRRKVIHIIRNPLKFWPFLLVAGAICAVPVVNIVTIPICIVAAVLTYSEDFDRV
jgi:CysZ protein